MTVAMCGNVMVLMLHVSEGLQDIHRSTGVLYCSLRITVLCQHDTGPAEWGGGVIALQLWHMQ